MKKIAHNLIKLLIFVACLGMAYLTIWMLICVLFKLTFILTFISKL